MLGLRMLLKPCPVKITPTPASMLFAIAVKRFSARDNHTLLFVTLL